MVKLNDRHIFHNVDSSPITIKEAIDVEEQSWHQTIDQSKFRIPEYQRNYSWERSHRNDFYSTLKQKFTELQPIPSNIEDMSDLVGIYMGALYVAVPGDDNQNAGLDIVDGQQRLSTFQLLLKTLLDYCNSLESEADEEGEFELKSELSEMKTELSSAFSGTDPSVVMNSEDEEFFKALAAYPDSWQTAVRDILVTKLEESQDENLDGRMRPRVKTVAEIINMIQEPLQTSGDFDLKEVQPFAGDTDDDSDDDEEEDEENESKLGEFIRYETSHERMFKAYEEAYELVDDLFEELTNGELDQRANVVMNFSSFILHAVIIDRCLISEPEPDLRLDIFQSINDKGRPLHNVDKIRARIKHRLIGEDDSGPMDEWRDTLARHGGDKDEIENMLVYYVASTEPDIDDIADARSELMNIFNRSVPEDSNVTARLTSDNATELVTSVSEYSKYYTDVKGGSFEHFSRAIDDANRQEVRRMLDRVGDKIDASQWYALGPWIYMQCDKKAPSDWDSSDIGDFLYEIFDAIEVATLRQSISERSGEAIEGSYVETVQNFNSRDTDDQFDSEEIVSDLANAVRNRSGDLFEDGLIDHFVKNRKWTSGAAAQCILQRATSRYLAENDIGLSVVDYSDIQIEHILPQSPISDRDNRTKANSDPGKYAWLEYFFRTDAAGDSPPIKNAVQSLIDEEISSLKSSDIDVDELSDDTDKDEIEQIQDEIYDRFIDDISNLLLLVDADNIENSNDLMSKKFPVYNKDEYLQVVVNDFFNGGAESDFAGANYVQMEEDDFDELDGDEVNWDSDAAERVDKSWNYEVMFQRKSEMVHQILQYLVFDLDSDDDEESGDSSGPDKDEFNNLQERIKSAVKDDRERRIGRRAF